MAEKSLWGTGKFCKDPTHLQPQETIQEISKAWKAISNAKAALRHIENKLDVAPTSSVIFDPIMDARESVGATRKISRKDGRYHDDTNSHPSKSSRPRKCIREKTSRSPLRVTTLESNVKSSCHVGFREPLASYRDAASVLSSSNDKKTVHPISGLNNGGQEEKDFDSTRTSAVDETSVRYLNDRLAIDALEWRLQQSHSDVQIGFREMKPSDTSQQHVSFSPSSNKLETLKRRQPDTKLEKLKERIRRQWEISVEKDNREGLPNTTNHTVVATGTKTRKVTAAPPPPSYRGFNPPETKIRTPDGKIWQETEFQNLSAQLHSTLAPSFQDVTPSSEKTKEKRTSRPVRKVQRLGGAGGSASPDGKMGHIISTSSWRDGQKLVKQILGPAPKVENEAKPQSNDQTNKQTSSTSRPVDKRSTSKERITEKSVVSVDQQRKGRSKSRDRHNGKKSSSKEPPKEKQDKARKSAHFSSRSESHHAEISSTGQTTNTSGLSNNRKSQNTEKQKVQSESTEMKKDFLPLEIRGILEDLQLDSAVDGTKQVRNRSHSPTKRKPEKGHVSDESHISSKRRHYDTEQVRLYIMRQQEERKKRQHEQREAQRQAEEQKNKRLKELYQKQKEAFSKAKSAPLGQHEKEAHETASSMSLETNLQRPHDTYTQLLLGQTWPEVSTKEQQTKPLYQPSGESDKENKGQERPHSASSSSDLSLSEPLQPLLRNDHVETYYPQPDRLTFKSLLPQSYSQTPGGSGILPQFLALPKDLESLFSNWKSSTNVFPSSHKANVQGKPSTDFKSNLDRIESLKATAVSLSSRIENEAKKLAGGSLNLPSVWSADPEPRQPIKAAWKKPDSPPERESPEDVFSSRMQKMLSTCSSNFLKDDLPGANHLYRKHPEELIPHTSPALGICDVGQEEKLSVQRSETSASPSETSKKASLSPNSSTSSISEGPMLGEASFSEEEGLSKHESRPNPAEALKNKEFCILDTKSFVPLSEFQREADKYLPLAVSNIRPDPWEELAKGSPHSVINIFTRSYQHYGKEINEHTEENVPDIQPVHSSASPQNSISYADDFVSSQASELAVDSQKSAHRSVDNSSSSAKEELSAVKSRSEGSSSHSSQPSSAASSPLSVSSHRGSSKWKGLQSSSPQLAVEIVQNVSCSEHKSRVSKQAQSAKEQSAGSESDSTMGDLSSRSITSLLSDGGRSGKSHHSSIKDTGGQTPSSPVHLVSQAPGVMAASAQSTIRFSPAGLQQRMSAELNYLGVMEESVRQLCDVERVRGISLAQQETVSLAQILKSQQQRHEQNMAALRLQAEQEAQASMRQLEEARQIAAQTQAEMLHRFQKTLEASASQNVVQVQEAVAHDYLSPTSSDPAAISPLEQQKRQHSRGVRKKGSRSASPSSQPPSSMSSFKERSHSSGSEQGSPPPSSVKEEIISPRDLEESISEELPTPEGSALKRDSSISIDDKGVSSAVPTNEEGIEELSFRSLLPSEYHRRGSLERQRSRRHESDEESTPDKELSGPFSSGQDSFWKFTMEMVRQYMQEGEMRSTHQAALLRLRQKALKEKTKAELAWLEHQKRSLRDKGEDDKMPPLKKRQRGLLLRLQQEQAEIKRLQEANKAARRERQLILKQQEEIQRIQNSTLRLQEKLKSAESGQLEQPSEGDVRLSPSSSRIPSDAESRSPSPVSVSGSETSSIMQKLRKMHSHMDAKFLTKREQQLVQRRLHAQELLEWKRRLDAEELEIRRIEKQALAAWEKPRAKTKSQSTEGEETVHEDKRSRETSPTPQSPAIHTRTSLSPPPEYLSSESIEPSTIAEQIHEQIGEHSSISEDLVLSALSKKSPPRSNKSPAELEPSKESAKSERQKVHITLRPHQLSHTWSEESLSMTHSEATSDQSDIEGRIRALKEELRKRKSVVENLKREQKRRQKERLRAQEAILLKQLQSYDEYIQKTQAELSQEQVTTPPGVKSMTKADQDLFSVRPDYLQSADSTSSCKAESEHITEISTRSEAENLKQEKSVGSRKEVIESIHDEPELVLEPFTAKEDVYVASSLSLPVKEALQSSAHGSPVSSIHSEILEDVLDAQSHRSISPLPVLNLHLRSETPEEYFSPQKDLSYSDDFESSIPLKLSISETPREELDVSLTTPGRDLHSEVFVEQEEDKGEQKSASSHFLDITEVKPSSPEHPPTSDVTDPLTVFQLGDRVLVSGVQPGTLRFKGETLFADGIWAGVELDKSEGNNDGSLGGSRYFVCSPLHGIFAPPHKIAQLVEEELASPSAERYILTVGTAIVNRDLLDGHLPLIEDFEQKTPDKTPLESTESSFSELHTLSIQEKQAEIPIDTSVLNEAYKEPQDSILELTEESHEDNFNKRAPEVGTISESLLQACLKDTVTYLQNIRKQRTQKIQQSNQEFHIVRASDDFPKQDQHQRLGPFQDFIEQKVREFDPSRSILSVLGEDADWFEEDFGLSSRKNQHMERTPSAGTVTEPSMLAPRSETHPKPTQPISPPELIMAVPHSVLEVEQLVQSAVDELWAWKRLSLDIAEIRNNFTHRVNEEQSPADSAYKEMLFDLTLYIFEEICSPDPRGSQPQWKKPVRVMPSYSRRVRDSNNIQEVKSFLTIEVLNLLSLKKEQNHKMDWQRMMKFGRKKRDRVDHILVQELHEEEAQWVNYDEDELFVKMQLADGIFEALIRDTIEVLQRIQSKKNPSPTV
ncbi:centrosome-associated protein 350 [Mantella aurantiaca]